MQGLCSIMWSVCMGPVVQHTASRPTSTGNVTGCLETVLPLHRICRAFSLTRCALVGMFLWFGSKAPLQIFPMCTRSNKFSLTFCLRTTICFLPVRRNVEPEVCAATQFSLPSFPPLFYAPFFPVFFSSSSSRDIIAAGSGNWTST